MANHDSPTYREYWTEIESYAEYFSDIDPDGEGYVADGYEAEDLFGAMNEILDGHQFVIYNNKALRVLDHSENDHAYYEQMGSLPDGETIREIAPPIAMIAMQQDILEHNKFDPKVPV